MRIRVFLFCGAQNQSMQNSGRPLARNTKPWLVNEQHRDDRETFAPIGFNGFHAEGREKACFDQQPVEVCATVSACLEVYRTAEEGIWFEEAQRVFRWFPGKNDLQVPLHDATTGGWRDGLHPARISENQGAESTLSEWTEIPSTSTVRPRIPRWRWQPAAYVRRCHGWTPTRAHRKETHSAATWSPAVRRVANELFKPDLARLGATSAVDKARVSSLQIA
jgi:hypothetical protein